MLETETTHYQVEESFALKQDAADPLRRYRERFHIPRRDGGEPVSYFCGNSLGLTPHPPSP